MGLLYSLFCHGLQKVPAFCNRVHNSHSRSPKVTDFSTNQKHTCNFLLLINSNLGSVLPVLIAGILPTTTTHPIFHTKFGDIPLGLDCQPGGSKEQSGQFPLSGPPIMQQAGSDLPYIHIRAAPRICGQLQQDARSSHQHNHTPSCYGGAG